jgi:hypothetical protein
MTGPLFGGKRTHIAAILYRTGSDVDVLRPDGNATENRYGKVADSDVSYSSVASERARRIYLSETPRGAEQVVTGGRLNTEDPRIALMDDTVAKEGDRLRFPDGQRYSLESRIDRDTHVEFRTTLIT